MAAETDRNFDAQSLAGPREAVDRLEVAQGLADGDRGVDQRRPGLARERPQGREVDLEPLKRQRRLQARLRLKRQGGIGRQVDVSVEEDDGGRLHGPTGQAEQRDESQSEKRATAAHSAKHSPQKIGRSSQSVNWTGAPGGRARRPSCGL